MKILIVDDNQNFRIMTKGTISKNINAEILEADDGREGITIVEKEKIDLILLDNEMPVMNGYEFLGKIRSNIKFKNIPVIVMTASDDSETISRYLNLDISDYILKPFNQDGLIGKIKKNVKFRKKILIIDDDRAFKEFIDKAISTRFSYIDLIKADDGLDGITKVLENKPDLILLDINMPEMTGIEFLKKMKSEYTGIDIPVVMLSSESDKDTILQIAQLNVYDFILKPISFKDFGDKLERILAKLKQSN